MCYEKRWGRIAVPCRFKVICLSVCRQVWGVRLRGSAEHGPDQLHHQAADRAGKRVPLQQVSDPCAPRWDCGCAAAEWDSGENLVSESEDEAEEEGERGAGASQGSIPWLWREDSRKNGRCRVREVNLGTLYSVPTIIHGVFHRGWALLLQLRTYCLFTSYGHRRPVYVCTYIKAHTKCVKTKLVVDGWHMLGRVNALFVTLDNNMDHFWVTLWFFYCVFCSLTMPFKHM